MSTHIVDRIEAIRFPAAEIGHYEDVYLVMELGGDNNVTNARTGRRARSWSASCIGMEWEVIGKCCEMAAGCSGGMTKLKGRQTKPESYIRAYRKALAEAVSLTDAASQRGIHVSARIRFARQEDGKQNYHLGKALAAGKVATPHNYFGTPIDVIEFNLNDATDLALWLECQHGYGFNNADVHGPGCQ